MIVTKMVLSAQENVKLIGVLDQDLSVKLLEEKLSVLTTQHCVEMEHFGGSTNSHVTGFYLVLD